MKTLVYLVTLLILLAHRQADGQAPPATPKRLVVNTYFGKAVSLRNVANTYAFVRWPASH